MFICGKAVLFAFVRYLDDTFFVFYNTGCPFYNYAGEEATAFKTLLNSLTWALLSGINDFEPLMISSSVTIYSLSITLPFFETLTSLLSSKILSDVLIPVFSIGLSKYVTLPTVAFVDDCISADEF